jgi:hypothetical protein
MKRQITYLLLLLLTFHSCLKEPDMPEGIVNGKLTPTVLSVNATSPIEGSLSLKGETLLTGKGNKITEKGFYWSFSSNDPFEYDNKVTVSEDFNSFFYELKNLPGDTIIYWRAFAKNESGCDTGRVIQYRTPAIIEAKHEFPSYLRKDFGIFSVSGDIYIACGEFTSTEITSDVWEYDIRRNVWMQSEDLKFIGGIRRCPVTFVIGDTAYVGTGERANGVEHSNFYTFNGKSKKWNQMPLASTEGALRISERYQAAGFGLNNKGYVVGGYSINHALSDVWQYSAENGGYWTKLHDFPVDFYAGICAYNDERVFVGFGNSVQSRKTLWEYDAKTDIWNEFAQLPDSIEKRIYSGVLIQDRIYIVDGDNDIWELNLSDKTWKKKRTLPAVFLKEDGNGGDQNLIVVPNSNSIYVGLGLTEYFYEYRPLWDN